MSTENPPITLSRRTLRLFLAGMYLRGVNDGASEGYGAAYTEATLDRAMGYVEAAQAQEREVADWLDPRGFAARIRAPYSANVDKPVDKVEE